MSSAAKTRLLAALLGLWALASAAACEPDRQPRQPSHGAVISQDPKGIFRPGRAGDHVTLVRIDSFDVASNDDRRLTLRFIGGNADCWSLERIEVDYFPERLTVEVYGGYHDLPGKVFCTAEGYYYELQMRLDEPVAGRTVEVPKF